MIGLRSGVDLVHVGRMRTQLMNTATPFLSRFLSEDEQREVGDNVERICGRWAVKEAVMKCLGQGIGLIDPLDIVVSSSDGPPGVVLHGSAQARAQELGLLDWSVSISHEAEFAIGFAVATWDKAGLDRA